MIIIRLVEGEEKKEVEEEKEEVEASEEADRAITDRSAGSRPGRPCSSEPRVPRTNSDAHHFH